MTEPKSVQEALLSPEKDKWKNVMKNKIQSPHENDVWELVELTDDRKVVGC